MEIATRFRNAQSGTAAMQAAHWQWNDLLT
jgi:hypothetical protein